MKKFCFILSICLASIFCFNSARAESSDFLVFKDRSYGNDIKLKISQEEICGSMLKVSYIVEIKRALGFTAHLSLSLQDKDGFEIAKQYIGRVHAHYQGFLKGNFEMNINKFKKISDIAIISYY